jgi:hypothetical protein
MVAEHSRNHLQQYKNGHVFPNHTVTGHKTWALMLTHILSSYQNGKILVFSRKITQVFWNSSSCTNSLSRESVWHSETAWQAEAGTQSKWSRYLSEGFLLHDGENIKPDVLQHLLCTMTQCHLLLQFLGQWMKHDLRYTEKHIMTELGNLWTVQQNVLNSRLIMQKNKVGVL